MRKSIEQCWLVFLFLFLLISFNFIRLSIAYFFTIYIWMLSLVSMVLSRAIITNQMHVATFSEKKKNVSYEPIISLIVSQCANSLHDSSKKYHIYRLIVIKKNKKSIEWAMITHVCHWDSSCASSSFTLTISIELNGEREKKNNNFFFLFFFFSYEKCMTKNSNESIGN